MEKTTIRIILCVLALCSHLFADTSVLVEGTNGVLLRPSASLFRTANSIASPSDITSGTAATISGTIPVTKVSGTAATVANVAAAQAFAIQRGNHTGTQTASTISDFTDAVLAISGSGGGGSVAGLTVTGTGTLAFASGTTSRIAIGSGTNNFPTLFINGTNSITLFADSVATAAADATTKANAAQANAIATSGTALLSASSSIVAQIPTDNNQLTNGAGYVTSSGSTAFATTSGSAGLSGTATVISGTVTSAHVSGLVTTATSNSAVNLTGTAIFVTAGFAFLGGSTGDTLLSFGSGMIHREEDGAVLTLPPASTTGTAVTTGSSTSPGLTLTKSGTSLLLAGTPELSSTATIALGLTGTYAATLATAAQGTKADNITQPIFFPESYGATRNARIVYHIASAGGSAVVTATSGQFTSGDVGKTAVVCLSYTNTVVKTISAVTSGTQITLSGTIPATNSESRMTYGTDDTVAVQSAIDAANTAGGGVIQFSSGVYMLSGTLKDTAHRNSVLLIPNPPEQSGSPSVVTLKFLGSYKPGSGYSGFFDYPVSQTGTILYFPTVASGTAASAVCGNAPDATDANYTSVNCIFENLDFRVPPPVTLNMLNFSHGGGVNIQHCAISVEFETEHESDLQPTSFTYVGSAVTPAAIWLPGVVSNSEEYVDDVNIRDYACGIITGDHAYITRCKVYFCYAGVQIKGHGANILSSHLGWNQNQIYLDVSEGALPVTALGIAFEGAESDLVTNEIGDSNDALSGFISYETGNLTNKLKGFTSTHIMAQPVYFNGSVIPGLRTTKLTYGCWPEDAPNPWHIKGGNSFNGFALLIEAPLGEQAGLTLAESGTNTWDIYNTGGPGSNPTLVFQRASDTTPMLSLSSSTGLLNVLHGGITASGNIQGSTVVASGDFFDPTGQLYIQSIIMHNSGDAKWFINDISGANDLRMYKVGSSTDTLDLSYSSGDATLGLGNLIFGTAAKGITFKNGETLTSGTGAGVTQSGNLIVTGTITGQGIIQVTGTASASVNFGTVLLDAVSITQTVAVTGCSVGDSVQLGLPSDGGQGNQKAWVSTSGTVSLNSFAAVALTSTAQTYYITTLKHP